LNARQRVFFVLNKMDPGLARNDPQAPAGASLSRSRFSLAWGLLVSALLHGLPLAGWLAFGSLGPAAQPSPVETLQLDVFGLLSDRQVEERRAEEAVQGEPELEPEPEPPPLERAPPKRRTPRPPPTPPPPTPPPPTSPPPARDEEAAQIGRTLGAREREATWLRQYLTELSRIVRSRLVYPVKARAKGWTGMVAVAFVVTEAGNVLPGSEMVHRSSGYAELDAAALNAVRLAGALPRPPKRMEVVISVNFREDE
jgi:TonB family protein